ncbi:MAG: J domain-containing protein [Desulfobacterales bacterium]|nr:J domain-containing protein [Desulfobacterales bacterium]
MKKYQKITKARKILELSEQASMAEIKSNYRKLLSKWHPDKCKKNSDQCEEKTREIISAYKIIISYCNQYKFSFSKEEVNNYLSGKEWWLERFGDDPLWGNQQKPE